MWVIDVIKKPLRSLNAGSQTFFKRPDRAAVQNWNFIPSNFAGNLFLQKNGYVPKYHFAVACWT
jgi:hypothetical protein